MKRIGAKGPTPAAVRTPTVLQMEAVECGAAALGIVLGYHGRYVSLPELRAACGVSRDGSNAANVVKAARSYGLVARGVSADPEDIRDLPMPCVIFWNFNHFIVVEGVVGDRVRINDPAVGRRSISAVEFDEGFTGVVLTFAPGPEFTPGGRPASPLRALRARLGGTPRELWPCLVAGLLLTVPGLALPMGMQLFVDRVLVGGQGEWLRPLIVGLVLLYLLQLGLSALKARYLREWHSRLSTRLTGGFLWHALRLPVSFFAQRYAGEIGGRAALNSGIAQALSGQLAAAAIDATMVIFYAAVMLAYDVPLTLLGVLFAAGNVAILRWIARRRADAALRARQEAGKLAGVSIAGLQGMETIKASALEASFFTRWAGHHARAVEAQQELGRTQQSIAVLPGVLSALTAAAILTYGGLRVMDGHITLGMLVAFVGLMASFQRPVGTLTQLAGHLQTLQADLMRVDDVLRNPLDVETERLAAPMDPTQEEPPPLRGSVELRGVTFGFSRSAPPLIVDLNLELQPGQRVALVGGSGSGKSTIAGLVCGLHQPWSGEILIDGLPRHRHSRARLAGTLALVDQDLTLFSGTVRENLTLWDSQVSQEQLEAACRDAEILDVVRALPGGFDADLLENGANLSGGQRQRLEIARALVGSPPLLVLDEATSALDAETERRVDANLRRRGCATLIVAHRLSTVRDADEILVLRAGQVVQRGRHDELARQEGDFRRLVVGEVDPA